MTPASLPRLLLSALILVTMLHFPTPAPHADGTPCTALDSMVIYSTWQGRVKAHVQHGAGVPDSFTTTGEGGFYFVRAKDRAGNLSDPSNCVRVDSTATADVPEGEPPAVPVHSRCGGKP